jgi:hypothetical protein
MVPARAPSLEFIAFAGLLRRAKPGAAELIRNEGR